MHLQESGPTSQGGQKPTPLAFFPGVCSGGYLFSSGVQPPQPPPPPPPIFTLGRRTFAVAGPTTWNLFQNNLRELDMQLDCFRRLFDQYSAYWAH